MNRLLKKRMLIISISLAFLLLINIGVSYSYYLGKVVGNESDTTLSFKSAGVEISYENNSGDINVGGIMPGWRATKNFSLSSNILETDFTNDQTKLWYEIILYIDQNNFPSNLITYTLTPNETIVGNGKLAEARANAGIETGTNDRGISLGLGYFTVGSNKHDYSITFNYVDIGSDYNNFPDSFFSVHIGAKVVVSSSIIIDLDGGSIEGTTTKYVSKGGTIVLPIPTKEGFIFDSWTITSGKGVVDGNNITVNDDVLNVTAMWRSKKVDAILVMDYDGGTSTQDTINSIKTNEIVTLETPSKTGYVFVGWELVSGDAQIQDNMLVAYDESVKILAIWESYLPTFTYLKADGSNAKYLLVDDSNYNWRIKFLESGTLQFNTLGNARNTIDVFLVGGGGRGNPTNCTGGGGGYTKTQKNVIVSASSDYSIVIGAGGTSSNANGRDTSAFNFIAAGGKSGASGGAGGSGGGGCNGGNGGRSGGKGGSNGGNGSYTSAGTGQGTTTYEFGASSGTPYSGGGGGAGLYMKNNEGGNIGSGGGAGGAGGGGKGATGYENIASAKAGTANTGGGGGAGIAKDPFGNTLNAGDGGSGIVIIRNHR